MNAYIATFYTHYAAMRAQRALAMQGICAELRPVPRTLSASCGACVYFTCDYDAREYLGKDNEAIYRRLEDRYDRIWKSS